jgi:peroxiredoxin Q/BCP
MSELNGLDAVIYGISTDPVAANTQFAQAQNLNYVLLSDVGGAVAQAFGVKMPNGMARRVTFVIDKEGVIRHVDQEVKVGTHGKDIQKALASLKTN